MAFSSSEADRRLARSVQPSWALVVGIVGALVGCGGGAKPKTPQCALNSDCTKLSPPGLVCAIGYCVKACNLSSDCPSGERCVNVTKSGDAGAGTTDGGMSLVAEGTACEAPELSTCSYNSDCKAPLVCGPDFQCRSQCQTNVDCPMQEVCTSTSHLCADPTIDKDYNATINDFVVNDAGVGIPQGGKSGSGTGGSSGTGSGGNGSGTGGSGGNGTGGTTVSCNPLTNFGSIAQGDANSLFTSGVGVHTADQFLIFSAYSGPRPSNFDGGINEDAAGADAAISNENFIFVQAFDQTSGEKKGPATPILQAADGQKFSVNDISIAPTGEIVLLHSSLQNKSDAQPDALYASFFSPTTAGVAVKLMRTVQIESAQLDFPHAAWAVPSQSFVLSWESLIDNTWAISIKKFLPGGTSPGSFGVVPTDDHFGGGAWLGGRQRRYVRQSVRRRVPSERLHSLAHGSRRRWQPGRSLHQDQPPRFAEPLVRDRRHVEWFRDLFLGLQFRHSLGIPLPDVRRWRRRGARRGG